MVAHCAQPTNEVKGARGSITPTSQSAWAAKGDAGHHGLRVTPPKKRRKKLNAIGHSRLILHSYAFYFGKLSILKMFYTLRLFKYTVTRAGEMA